MALAPATTFHYRLVAQTAAGRFEGPDGTFRTKAPARAATAVTVVAVAHRYRHSSSVVASGSLRASASACSGSALVQIIRGSDTISLRPARIRAHCSFATTAGISTSRLHGAHRLLVRALFLGNAMLLPATSRAVVIRV